MKYLILAAAFLLGFTIVQADTYVKIDPNTVQVTPTPFPTVTVSPDQLKGQIDGLQARIDSTNREIQAFTATRQSNIALWQAKIDEINNAIAAMGIVLK